MKLSEPVRYWLTIVRLYPFTLVALPLDWLLWAILGVKRVVARKRHN